VKFIKYVPTFGVVKVQVYVAMFAVPPTTGPVAGTQVIPVTPVTAHVPAPEGVAPPTGPVTVAVIVTVDPRVGAALELKATVGVDLETIV